MGETNARKALPAYDGTVFISYARADDVRPPFDEATQGWVTFFWHQLRFELTNGGVPQADLWLDRYEIEPAEKFTEKIEAAIGQARLIIPILSTNWVQRDWCQQELSRFVELSAKSTDDIVLVKKQEPPEIPELLKNREGYKFYTKDPTGRVREFYWRGLKDEAAYFDVLKNMADLIVARLTGRTRTRTERKNRTIFIAAAADELRDAWQRLANDLEGAGFTVVPHGGRLPDTAAKAEEAIRAALGAAEMSVHLLGESEGAKPDGSEETFARMQLRLDRQTAEPASRRARVLWAPKWLPNRGNEKRDPFQVVERFGSLQTGEQVFAEEVTDLSQWLRQQLEPRRAEPARAPVFLLVAAAAEEDEYLVSGLANRLQSDEITVRPMFTGDTVPMVPAGEVVALVPWGEAKRDAIDSLLTRVSTIKARVYVLCLPDGDQIAKRRFYQDGIYAERIEQLPSNPRAARELLVQLGILRAGERGAA